MIQHGATDTTSARGEHNCPQECRQRTEGASQSAPFLRLFLFVLVNRNRIQILGLKYLAAIETANVIDTVPPV
jgi:hypothetical protein